MTSRRPRRPGPGSLRLLEWLARLGVAGIEPTRLALGLSQPTAYSHVARLKREGLLWRIVVGDGQGAVIAVTPAGAREARAHGAEGLISAARATSPRTGRHGREVSWVAASLSLRDLAWVGPAQLHAESSWRSQREDGQRHSPDLGLVHRDGSRTAIEVELSRKSSTRLKAILAGYGALVRSGQLNDVSYVTDRRDVSELVRRQAVAVGVSEYVRVGPLDEVISSTRTRALAGRRVSR